MRSERIRSTPSWRKGPPRRDTIFVSEDNSLPGMQGLLVARALLLFSFTADDVQYSCALVHWFSRASTESDEDTGMWVVEPDRHSDGSPVCQVIHLDTILRAAHLLPVFGKEELSEDFNFTDTLDAFNMYYVNKFADHHTYEITM